MLGSSGDGWEGTLGCAKGLLRLDRVWGGLVDISENSLGVLQKLAGGALGTV